MSYIISSTSSVICLCLAALKPTYKKFMRVAILCLVCIGCNSSHCISGCKISTTAHYVPAAKSTPAIACPVIDSPHDTMQQHLHYSILSRTLHPNRALIILSATPLCLMPSLDLGVKTKESNALKFISSTATHRPCGLSANHCRIS